jgi:hypothetical protein
MSTTYSRSHTSKSETPKDRLPVYVWVVGTFFRSLFIVLLMALTLRVASPQIETIWNIYETPSDLARMMLGFVVSLWLVINLFILPKDADGYRTWLYLGIPVLPLTLLCAVVIW